MSHEGAASPKDTAYRPLLSGALLALLVVVLLLPFINKAFHIDDPFYVWVGQHIVQDPFDFYGFTLNWQGAEEPVADINKNPPGVSYFIALVGTLFGWQERTLHLAFMLPAVLVITGAYVLARKLTQRPHLAALVVLVSPVFLLSASNIMAEMTMFAFYLWAVILWVDGLQRGRILLLLASGVLIGLAGLTKYFGISALPLLFVYGLAYKRRLGRWALPLLIPVAMFAAYEVYTAQLYGSGHLVEAILFAEAERVGQGRIPAFLRAISGLCFLGGCFISAALFAPLQWRFRTLAIALVTTAGFAAILYAGLIDRFFIVEPDLEGVRMLYVAQFALFTAAGAHILALAGKDLWKLRNPESLLLALWIFGTFLFAIRFNWAINGRSLLPAIVPAGILAARTLDARSPLAPAKRQWPFFTPLIPAACVALAVSWADYRQANSVRDVARYILEELGDESQTVWYQGHWGFQYYMDRYGGKHLDIRGTYVNAGDLVVTPRYAMSSHDMLSELAASSGYVPVRTVSWVAVWNPERGVGYYADNWGPAPYAFIDVPPDRYTVVTLAYTGLIETSIAIIRER